MKRNVNAFYILLIFIFLSVKGHSQELLINGNMEFYGGYANFEYVGGGYNTLSDPLSGNSIAGNNVRTNNPKNFNTIYMSIADHSIGMENGGQMLVVDGGNLGNGQYFWKAGYGGNGFCGLVIGKTYTFSYWVRSVSNLVTNPSTQADIKIDFSNATDIDLVSGKSMVSLPSDGWQKVTYRFKATNNCVNINLWDNNTNSTGNDFAQDDFSLLEGVPLTVTYSLSYGSNGIELFPYSMGGNQNIASWSLKGPMSEDNVLNFKHLIPGNYVLTVVDIDAGTASCNVVITSDPKNLSISGNTSICGGGSTVLSANGGNSIYEWYSFPTDISITDASSATQTVSPEVTTNYVVKSSYAPGTENLIYNGDFSLGNTGFGTWHKYYPTNFGNTPKAYSVVKNPSDWDPSFLNCGDHTDGNGNMLVVNGLDDYVSGSGGKSFWEQAVKVIGTTDYVFSFWVKSLSNLNPAKLTVTINGSHYNVYPFDAPANNACGNWVKYSVNYFSGWLSDVAVIQISNSTNTFIGNDFAIDDITLTPLNSLSTYSNVTVTVDPPLKPIEENNLITENEIQFNWGQVPYTTGYKVSYSINNGGIIDGGIITANTYSVNSLNPGDLVTLIVEPIGNGCFGASQFTANTYLPCPVPVISVVKQPTCIAPQGSITVNSPIGSEFEYGLDGVNFQKEILFINVSEGSHSVSIKNIVTSCQSVSNLVTLNSSRAVLPDISASYSYKDCAILLMATSVISNSTIVWNGPTLDLNTANPAKVSVSGKFTATVKDLSTGCDNSFDLDVVMPSSPVAPLFSSVDPTCTNAYGEIIVNSPLSSNYEYSVNGISYQVSGQFSNLIAESYNVTVKDVLTSCVSLPSHVVLTKPSIVAPEVLVSNERLCQNSNPASLIAIALPNATLNWYGTSKTDGVPSLIPTIPSTSILGTTIYYVSQLIDLCESPRTPITINVSGVGETPGFTDLSFCKGDFAPVLSEISPKGIKGVWQPSIIDNLESNSYHFTPNQNLCAVEQTINVTINLPTLKTIDWKLSKAFGDNQTIEVKASDEGNYLYQIDDEIPQTSSLFENVRRGYHSIKVYDVNGCSNPITNDKVLVINLSNYFTPNGDSYNDFWDISDLRSLNEATVFIYDRYGKLIKTLFPSKDIGWDGTYYNQEMPSSDYWFVVNYNENGNKEEYRGHFSLKR